MYLKNNLVIKYEYILVTCKNYITLWLTLHHLRDNYDMIIYINMYTRMFIYIYIYYADRQ